MEDTNEAVLTAVGRRDEPRVDPSGSSALVLAAALLYWLASG